MDSINKKQVGARIKDIRLSLGESMEQFGARFNTSKGTVNNWEKGRNIPNRKNLKEIALISGTPVSVLLKGSTAHMPFRFPDLVDILSNPDYYVTICRDMIITNTPDNYQEDLYFMLTTGVVTIFNKVNINDNIYDFVGFPPELNREEWVTCDLYIKNFFKGSYSMVNITFSDLKKLISFLDKLIDSR